MELREQVIGYPSENLSKTYDSIDEVLCILGGKQKFSMRPRINDMIYTYDFYDNATAMISVASRPQNYMPDYQNVRHPITVRLIGFKEDSFYEKVYSALTELKNPSNQP